MPKVIPGVKDKLLNAARAHLVSDGSDTFSLRSIASECKIAVGTVYNYFPSKEMLIAQAIASDWLEALQDCDEKTAQADSFESAVSVLMNTVEEFGKKYKKAFSVMSGQVNAIRFYQGRDMLQEQMVSRFTDLCDRFDKKVLRKHAIVLTAAMRECMNNPEVPDEELFSLFDDIEGPSK